MSVRDKNPWPLIVKDVAEDISTTVVDFLTPSDPTIWAASPILKYFKVTYKTIEKDEEKIVP